MNKKCRDRRLLLLLMLALAGTMLGGCGEDDRLVRMAEQASQRQAEQNKEIARQNQQVAETTKALVEADAKARQEATVMQGKLRADQAEIGHQRDNLEVERKRIAAERQWDQLLAPALLDFGGGLMIVAVLGFCGYLLIGLRHENNTEQAVGELLVQELVCEQSILLPPATLPMAAIAHPLEPELHRSLKNPTSDI
jgi:hypothetical protein